MLLLGFHSSCVLIIIGFVLLIKSSQDDGVEPERCSCNIKLLGAYELEVKQNLTSRVNSYSGSFAEKSFLATPTHSFCAFHLYKLLRHKMFPKLLTFWYFSKVENFVSQFASILENCVSAFQQFCCTYARNLVLLPIKSLVCFQYRSQKRLHLCFLYVYIKVTGS